MISSHFFRRSTASMFDRGQGCKLIRGHRFLLRGGLVMLATLLGLSRGAQSAQATNYTWLNGTSDLKTAANWSPAVYPTQNGDGNYVALFNSNSTPTAVTFATGSTNVFGGITVASSHTSPLSITNIDTSGTAQQLRIANSGGFGMITINSSAGAFTLDNSGAGSGTQIVFQSAGTYTFTNNSVNTATLSLGSITNARISTAGGVSATALFTGSGDWVMNGQITQAGGTIMSLTKSGTGTLTLNLGFAANGYIGPTTITAGTLKVGAASGIIPISAAASNVTLNGGASAAGTLDLNDFNLAMKGLDGTTGAVLGQVVNNGSAALRTLTVGTQNANGSFAGLIKDNTSGSGTIALTKTGTGIQTLSGANTYSGNTTITNGTLQVGSTANVIPNGSGKGNVVLNGGGAVAGTLDLNNFNETINGLGGTSHTVLGQIVNNGSAALRTLTVGDGDATASFAGLIKDNTSGGGTVGLTKIGTGTQTLSGANTYTGPTTVSAGTLLIHGDNSAASGAVTVAASATLGGRGIIGGPTTISGTHSPGASPGIQTFLDDLTYEADPDNPDVNWELIDNTVINAANPNALFDTIEVGGDLDFADDTSLNLIFNGAGSSVDWNNSFWDSSRLGGNGWLLYDVEGATSNFDNLLLTMIDWSDSNTLAFSTARPGSSFFVFKGEEDDDIYLNYLTVNSAIPEPATFALAALGLLGLGVVVCRKRVVGEPRKSARRKLGQQVYLNESFL